MARRMKRNGEMDEGPKRRGRPPKEVIPQLSNSAARLDAINGTMETVYGIDSRIAALIEEHITPLKDQRTKKVRELKAVTGIDSGDFRLSYALFRRTRDADAMEGEDKDRIHDNLKELWSALNHGGQLDWLEAIGPGEDAGAGEDDEENELSAEDQGRVAADKGLTTADCPFAIGELGRGEWIGGWKARTKERLEHINRGEGAPLA